MGTKVNKSPSVSDKVCHASSLDRICVEREVAGTSNLNPDLGTDCGPTFLFPLSGLLPEKPPERGEASNWPRGDSARRRPKMRTPEDKTQQHTPKSLALWCC
eukprot:15476346-Alexandrium_andersonii.AAC.1